MKEFIKCALNDGIYHEGINGSGIGSTTAKPVRYATKQPMINLKWGQSWPYNKYCYGSFGEDASKNVVTGCSTTAMAMILTNNEFPDNLIINDILINWSSIKEEEYAHLLRPGIQEHVALLMGSIFNNVLKIATTNFTLITPQQIKNRMIDFGYQNVRKLSGGKFSSQMVDEISKMLNASKPIFISAIPDNWTKAHSWIIDGAKYSADGTYLLHFNFGWRGLNNGYFSTNCLNPNRGIEYDEESHIDDVNDDYFYSWHFRLITYDIPARPFTKSITFKTKLI